MTATYLGGGSVGAFMPTTIAALAGAEAAVALPIADVQAKISGAIAASASIAIQPPSLDLAAALQAAASLPGVSVDVSAMTTLATSLGVELGALQAALELVLALKLPFATAGIHAYELQGQVGQMGSDLGGQLSAGVPGGSGPSQLGTAVVLVAADNGAIQAIQALFAI
jgi:hypothetical protein